MTTVTEWEVVRGLSERDLDSLIRIAAGNRGVLEPCISHGRLAIRTCNYVGTIGFSDGTFLEILPRMGDDAESRRVAFMRMLTMSSRISSRKMDRSNLGKTDDNIFEIFIRMYLKELSDVIRKGLARSYADVKGNEPFVKGKIIHSEDIRHNSVTRSGFFVEFSTFNHDCPENRIVRKTLGKLLGRSRDPENRRRLRTALGHFEKVSDVADIDAEFKKCVKSRNTSHYSPILEWSRLFLDDFGLTVFHDSNISYTFLFPMELIYQEYVINAIRMHLPGGWTISGQDTGRYLFDDEKVRIRPDIVITNGERTIIADTKWKRIGVEGKITNSDLYQMYVYSIRYKSKKTVILHPTEYETDYTDSTNSISISSMRFAVEDEDGSVNRILRLLC